MVRGTEIFKKAAMVPAIKLSIDMATEKKITSFKESFLFLSISASNGLQYILMINFKLEK